MNNLWIRVSYSLLIAVVVALTAASAATMVITGPRPPNTPSLTFAQLQSDTSDPQQTNELITTVDRFYQDTYEFRQAYPDYQRNMLLAAILLATIIGAVGIILTPPFNALRLGLTLGAILLLLWGAAFVLAPIPNPAPSDSSSVENLLAAGLPPGLDLAGRFLRFGAAFIALLVFLFLGLWRLTEWPPAADAGARNDAGRREHVAVGSGPAGVGGATTTAYQLTEEHSQWQRPGDH
jgi:hypothetical protein